MSRNVFLSILGTGNYQKTKYYFGSKSDCVETNFIQEATIRLFCKDWSENDAFLIYLTKNAREKNWNSSSERDYKGLSEVIENLNFPCKVEHFYIPDGNNESEIWEIFNVIYNSLKDEDKLYVDITHSFRSIPMLLVVLLNYAKVLKHVSVESITYGNWEGRDQENYAPIIDLTPLSHLQDWTIAANNFVEFGIADKLVFLTKQEISPILKNTQGRDEVAANLRNFSDSLNKFISDLQTVRGLNIFKGNIIDGIKKCISSAMNNNNLLPQLNPLLKEIQKKINPFLEKENINNIFAATDWHLKHGNYQQAYSILLEGVITYICRSVGIPINKVDHRELVTSACYIIKNNINEDRWDEKCNKHREVVLKVIDFLQDKTDIIDELLSLSELRNDFMHAGFRENASQGSTLKIKIERAYNNLNEIISKYAY